MFISEEKIRAVLTYEALIPAIRQALIDYSAGRVEQPPRSVLRVKDAIGSPTGWFAVMPVIAGEYLAAKTVTFYPGNAALTGPETLPTHMATIELLSRFTGEPLAVMDGRLITEMRTAAVSAVAVQALAPPDTKIGSTLGILGSGVQARAHIEALRLTQPSFREPKNLRIWSRNPQNSATLADELGATASSIEETAASDVVVVATSATQPILQGKWLSPRSLVVAIGAVGPQLRELDDEAMQGYLIAESRQGVERESGDVILSNAKVHAEIGEILAGTAQLALTGRRIFKSVGMAIEDLTCAALVWQTLKSSLS
jgi:ornithine cyclodeaminase/alanine dehydrogenase-like protein (mu-crystallin family)